MSSTGQTCRVVKAGAAFEGKQALNYFPGISAESAGASGLCLHLLEIPPGGHARAHLHQNHETAIFVLTGQTEMYYGERLEQRLLAEAGDFIYIPAGMPHMPFNLSERESCSAIVARTDPNEQESVVLLPELEQELLGRRATAGQPPR